MNEGNEQESTTVGESDGERRFVVDRRTDSDSYNESVTLSATQLAEYLTALASRVTNDTVEGFTVYAFRA